MSDALTDVNLSKLSKADLVQVLTQVLANGTPAPAKEDEPKTSKQRADELIEASPFTHTTGRVYLSGAHVEAAARVLKTGTPELVPTVEGKRTAAVVLWLQGDDSVAAQNLRNKA